MVSTLIPVGIDVSKATLHVAILQPDRPKAQYQSFDGSALMHGTEENQTTPPR
jgi:transposase